MCSSNFDLRIKPLPQVWQRCGRSPVYKLHSFAATCKTSFSSAIFKKENVYLYVSLYGISISPSAETFCYNNCNRICVFQCEYQGVPLDCHSCWICFHTSVNKEWLWACLTEYQANILLTGCYRNLYSVLLYILVKWVAQIITLLIVNFMILYYLVMKILIILIIVFITYHHINLTCPVTMIQLSPLHFSYRNHVICLSFPKNLS